MHKLEVLTQISTWGTRPRTSPQSRAISTGSDLGRPPLRTRRPSTEYVVLYMEFIAHVKVGRLRMFSEPYDARRRSTDAK